MMKATKEFFVALEQGISKLGHIDDCLESGAGDGAGCFCGFYEALKWVERMKKQEEKKDEE